MNETLEDLTRMWLTDERMLNHRELSRLVCFQYAEIGRLQEELEKIRKSILQKLTDEAQDLGMYH